MGTGSSTMRAFLAGQRQSKKSAGLDITYDFKSDVSVPMCIRGYIALKYCCDGGHHNQAGDGRNGIRTLIVFITSEKNSCWPFTAVGAGTFLITIIIFIHNPDLDPIGL